MGKVKSQMHSLAFGQAMGKAAEDYKQVGALCTPILRGEPQRRLPASLHRSADKHRSGSNLRPRRACLAGAAGGTGGGGSRAHLCPSGCG